MDQPLLTTEDNRSFLKRIKPESIALIVTSPPYGIGKEYEDKTLIGDYVRSQGEIIRLCIPLLRDGGSICWQVGNHVDNGVVTPLDAVLFEAFAGAGLKCRNRIVWHFGHGMHCKRRFSGRHETVLWFTKGDDYVFNLDPVRTPQKYRGKKHFKGPNAGRLSCNPLGANPSDFWFSDVMDIPNVKANHCEKTDHPCQFPVELAERLVLALTNEGDVVLDPYLGSGTTAVAAMRHGRMAIGCDVSPRYMDIARERIRLLEEGRLKIRPMGPPKGP